ncbi:MAG: disulfide bond formation protein B [Pararhizobium sp.]
MNDATQDGSWPMLFSAFAIALLASLSVLFIGEVMGQAPCNLCWFQRAFMFPLAVILGLAALRSDVQVAVYGIVLAACGWLIAAFHTLVYAGIIPEAIQPCTASGPSCSSTDMTILGGVPLPLLSVAAFTAIIILLLLSRRRSTP